MKSKIFLASFAFLALFSVVSCELISDKAQAEPTKNLQQTQISATRISKTLKTANQMWVMNNNKLHDAIIAKIAADKVATEVITNINAELSMLLESIYIDPTTDNALLFAKWSKSQAQLVDKLTKILGEFRNSSTIELKKWTVPSYFFDDYAAPLLSQSEFSAMSIDEQRTYVHVLQQDLLILHNALLHNIYAVLGKVVINYDKFDVWVNPAQSCFSVGDEYEAEIALGAYSSQAKFMVSVDGQPLQIVKGKAIYKAPIKEVGRYSYDALISVSNPMTGEVEKMTKTIYYQVGK
jgi:hypothetical protein